MIKKHVDPCFKAVGILRREKTITVALMNDILVCYSSKGKKMWQQQMPAAILALEPVDIDSRGVQFTAVALKSNKVVLFNDKHVVDVIK